MRSACPTAASGSATATSGATGSWRSSRPRVVEIDPTRTSRRRRFSRASRSTGGSRFALSKLHNLMPKLLGLKCRECGTEYELQATHVCEMCFGPPPAAHHYPHLHKK